MTPVSADRRITDTAQLDWQSLPSPVLVLTTAGEAMAVNAAFSDFTGLAAGAARGAGWRSVFSDEAQVPLLQALAARHDFRLLRAKPFGKPANHRRAGQHFHTVGPRAANPLRPQRVVADARRGIGEDDASHAMWRVDRGPERGHATDRNAANVGALSAGGIDHGEQILAETIE